MTNKLSFSVSQIVLVGRAIARAKGLGGKITQFAQELKNLEQISGNDPPTSSSQDGHLKIKCICVNSLNVTDPSGVVLVENLSLRVERGRNMLIEGPNGVGKSTLLRYLSAVRRAPGGL